jgi:exosortase
MNADVMVLTEPEIQHKATPDPGRTRSYIAAAAVIAGAIALSYLPNLLYLIQTWSNEPNYSHGFLVAPIAAFLLWHKRNGLAGIEAKPNPWGWVLLIGLLALRAYLFERNEKWTENATIPLVVTSLVLALAGWKVTKWALPALGFLFFLLPMPLALNQFLAGPLQTVATIASTGLLQATGLSVVAEGHMILVGTHPLEVAQACNGLSMLLSFIALITAVTIYIDDRPVWERVVLMLSTIPIALIANVLRITATAWCYHMFGEKFGNDVAHAGAGWAMMPIALILVWLELQLFSWLVVEEQETHAASIFIAPPTAARVVKK